MLFIKLLTAMIGSGILSLPYILHKHGMFTGLCILIGVWGFLVLSGLLLISNIGVISEKLLVKQKVSGLFESVGYSSKNSLTTFLYRNCAFYLVIGGLIIHEFGALTSYIFILISSFNPETLYERTCVGLFLLPILIWLLHTDLTRITWFSTVSMVGFFGYKLYFLYDKTLLKPNCTIKALEVDVALKVELEDVSVLSYISSISVCFFACICHTTLYDLAHYTTKKMLQHFITAAFLGLSLYIVTSVSDNIIFSQINPNILDTVKLCIEQNIITKLIPFLFYFGILTTIPVLFIGIAAEFKDYDLSAIKLLTVTAAISLGIFFKSLTSILSLFGLVAGVVNAIIIPLMSLAFRQLASEDICLI